MIETLFTQALGLAVPWEVVDVKFSPEQHRIDFHVVCQAGADHACPACGAGGTAVHDWNERSWRHLDFFQYEAYLHAEVPRVKCPHCGKVSQVEVPWARPGSRFTLLFEALVVGLAPLMSVAGLARQMRVGDDPLWRILNHHVKAARALESHAGIEAIGVDETAAKRGQRYISVFFDLGSDRLLFATEGRSKETFKHFVKDFADHGGVPNEIRRVSMDMSASFQAGVAEQLPEATVCFDRFHVVALASEALDEVRRAEQKSAPELKGSRWALLKKPLDWTVKQLNAMYTLQRSNLKTARAWRLKEALREIYRTATSPEEAEPLLARWRSWASRCRLEPFKKLARTLKTHWEGVLNGFNEGCHNGKVEAMNRSLQEARARARGYRRTENFINMAYLIAGKLTHLPKSPFAKA
jgi:transposase